MSQNEPQRRRIDPSVMAALIGGVFTLLATVITLTVNNQNNQPKPLTAAPSAVVQATSAEAAQVMLPTDTSVPPTSIPATDALVEAPTSATPLPTNTVMATGTFTPTDAPTNTSAPTDPPANPENVVSAPTAAPEGWHAVQFAYSAKGFFWVNLSSSRFAARRIRFERIDGTSSYEGTRWAQFGRDVFPGGCMRLNAYGETAFATAPAACIQINSTVNSNSQEMFWTQPFRVLWEGTEIAICPGGEGECNAYLPG